MRLGKTKFIWHCARLSLPLGLVFDCVLTAPRHTLIALLAAAAFGLSVAGGVSCSDGPGPAPVSQPAAPSADTLALVEGLRLFEEGRYDLAREQLEVSARSSGSQIRAESYLYLNALEMELGNYDAARPWLEKYHAETVRLLRGAAEASARVAEQTARLRRRQDTLIVGVLVFVVLSVGAVIFFVRRRRELPGRAASLDDGSVARLDDGSVAGLDPEDRARWMAAAETFRRSAIYDEVTALASQKPGREARVLTAPRQDALDAELAAVFADFASHLRTVCPSLTSGDVKLCCLSLLPLSPFGRALCWGSTETNIVKQRKHTIKKKLCLDPVGRALFNFIFDARK